MTRHPAEVIEHMVESEANMFDTDPGVHVEADSEEHWPAYDEYSSDDRWRAVCVDWVQAGYCEGRGEWCDLAHPKKMKGLSQKAQKTSNDQRGWGSSGDYGHGNYSGGNEYDYYGGKGGKGGRGGKGRGSSGKGGNGGKGRGQSGNNGKGRSGGGGGKGRGRGNHSSWW